jgi:prepilin-type N-terminal cleavage/methylation domain-containing protein
LEREITLMRLPLNGREKAVLKRGFTLIELRVVIAIIRVLIALLRHLGGDRDPRGGRGVLLPVLSRPSSQSN